MVTRLRWTVVLGVLGLMVGGLWFIGGEAAAQPTQFQATDVFEFGAPDDLVPGAANLTRTNRGISFRVYTTELDPGAAHTMWVVIFNRPENCEDGCDGADLNNPDVEGSIVYGTGYIAGENGAGNFHGSLEKGNPPAGIQVNVPAGTANGLKDPFKAEVHLVVRTHGAPIEGQAAQQLTTFEDDCDEAVCQDVQAAVFPPPDGGDGEGEN